jgi:hypothetical protein
MELDLILNHMIFNDIVAYGKLEWMKRKKTSLGGIIRNVMP